MQRQKIKPVVDVPLILEMETVYGEECSSQYNGVEYRYNVRHEGQPSLIYLPASGRDAILHAAPSAGEHIELLKQKRGSAYVFQAQRFEPRSDAYEPPTPPAPMTRYSALDAQREQRTGGVHMVTAKASARPMPQLEPPFPDPRYEDPSIQAAPRPPVANESDERPSHTQTLFKCLRASFDAWQLLRAHAESKGVALDYTSEDVRSAGLSVYIGIQKNGGAQ